ncbi:diguanylate cyclase AdrA [Comamonadaceae bacterium]
MSNFEDLSSLLNDDTGTYGRQRANGFKLLKFESTLELQYSKYIYFEFEKTRKFALIALVLSLFSWLFWDIWQASRANFPIESTHIFAIRLSMISIALLCLILVWNSKKLIFTTLVIQFNLSVSSVGTLLIILTYVNSNEFPQVPILFDGITLMTIAFLFPLGLSFRLSAFVTALHVIFCIICTQFFLIKMNQDVVSALIPFQVTSFIALFGLRYYQEYSSRLQFLYQGSLRLLAGTDPLSGLNNRRVFEGFVKKAILQSDRLSKVCSFLVIDIDNFKKYNDSLGHPMGDLAIRRISDLIQRATKRPLDCTGRLGGEEFAIFLYDADLLYAEELARNLIRAVPEELKIELSKSSTEFMTISIGITTTRFGETYEDTYQRADIALYKAKNAGRSRYICSEKQFSSSA